VDRDAAIAEYEKAIQSAFREVSDSLSLRTRLMEQQDAQPALVKSLEDTYHLSEAHYKAGIDSYLPGEGRDGPVSAPRSRPLQWPCQTNPLTPKCGESEGRENGATAPSAKMK
jgi:hypothetical protein